MSEDPKALLQTYTDGMVEGLTGVTGGMCNLIIASQAAIDVAIKLIASIDDDEVRTQICKIITDDIAMRVEHFHSVYKLVGRVAGKETVQ